MQWNPDVKNGSLQILVLVRFIRSSEALVCAPHESRDTPPFRVKHHQVAIVLVNIIVMAGNEASFAFTAGDMLRATAYVGLASFIALLVFVSRMLPTMDAREPPLLKPTIPAIGHTIALIRQQTRFLPLL